ncbi:MAG: hypothetical protein QY325_04350 [Flavobacteriales bacterium]|nr:MAG: hypothetical protein QY325_04350 [Flavobacteriales bacterium]
MAAFGPLSAERFRDLLMGDASFATEFVVNNNPQEVADRLNDLGLNRPVGPNTIWECLQALLNNGDDGAFVDALSVSLDTDGMPMEYRQVLLTLVQQQGGNTVVAGGLPSQRISNTIAQQALANYKAASASVDAQASTNGMGDDGASSFLDFYKPKAGTPAADKRKRVMRALLWGGLAIVAIVGVALLIRNLKK